MNIKSIGSKIKGNPTMVEGTVYSMLIICSISHFLNDMIQSIIPSIYPIVKDKFDFSFAQIGIITLVFQMTSSILQPFTGLYADKHPRPYALSIGMCFTLMGLLLLAFAENYFLILLAVSVVGLGSSVFHPTASRVAQMASGGKKSLAQSIFQVGGNGGSAIGPLLAAIIILPFGQHAISWFALAALLAAIIMVRLGAMAMMSLKLWQLAALALPMIVILLVQTVVMFLYANFLVFNIMGRDYEAAAMTTAFCGFGMGATPNAMANMRALVERYGPAPRAFFIVPLVGSLFVDFFNSMVLTTFMNLL